MQLPRFAAPLPHTLPSNFVALALLNPLPLVFAVLKPLLAWPTPARRDLARFARGLLRKRSVQRTSLFSLFRSLLRSELRSDPRMGLDPSSSESVARIPRIARPRVRSLRRSGLRSAHGPRGPSDLLDSPGVELPEVLRPTSFGRRPYNSAFLRTPNSAPSAALSRLKPPRRDPFCYFLRRTQNRRIVARGCATSSPFWPHGLPC